MVAAYTVCQVSRPSPSAPPLVGWQPAKNWERVHVDFFGPFLDQYFFLMIDTASGWTEAWPVAGLTSGVAIKCLRRAFSRQPSSPTSLKPSFLPNGQLTFPP